VLVLSRLGITPGQVHPSAGGGNPEGAAYTFPPRIGLAGFLGCLYIGCFEMGVTFVLWMKALSLTERTAQVSNLILLSPFISLIFIRFVVGEHIMLSSMAGLVLIVAGVLIQRSVK
ncbi:MAG: EamA family transporter, partial [Chitinivibrionia bacterium]|nr:EamA family transporter [Chitinivibrionia bacterium]